MKKFIKIKNTSLGSNPDFKNVSKNGNFFIVTFLFILNIEFCHWTFITDFLEFVA